MKIRWETDYDPCEWDELLKRLRIDSDAAALDVMETKSNRSKELRIWIAGHMYNRYVPTPVLRAIQFENNVNLRFLAGMGD